MRTLALSLCCALVLVACRKEPSLPSGESIACDVDADCPLFEMRPAPDEDYVSVPLRCFDGLCVVNTPPQVLEFDAPVVRIEVGNPVSITARAFDPEGDAPLTLVWRQVSGPEGGVLIPATFAGETFAATPTVVGRYTLEVVAHDPYDESDPLPDGVAVRVVVEAFCTRDDECSMALRCYDDACVRNNLPVIVDLPAASDSVIGQPFSLTAAATDPEGDPVTLTWTQLSGPEAVLSAPSASATLAFTPAALGAYVFELRASDGYDAAASDGTDSAKTTTVMVLPAETTVYLADSAEASDAVDCGTLATPCGSLASALLRLRDPALAAAQLFVGASASLDGYAGCLDLRGSERVVGCFDPDTWRAIPDGRSACRIVCDNAAGHSLSATARVEDVTLAMVDGLVPAPASKPVPTVHIAGGSPTLRDVDIETAACGASCTAVGVLAAPEAPVGGGAAVDSSPTLACVNVVGGGHGFTTVAGYVGVWLVGGTPQVTGGAPSCAAERGTIVLDVPANVLAVGVRAVRAHATVTGVTIEGGLASALTGIEAQGSQLSATGNTIRLTSFGTRMLVGISSEACTTEMPLCSCNPAVESCAGVAPSVIIPAATVDTNHVFLSSGAVSEGMVPCLGLGIRVDGAKASNVVTGNHVDVGDTFTLGMGALVSGTDLTGAGVANRLETNELLVGSSTTDALCELLNRQSLGPQIYAGSMGVLAVNDDGLVIKGNEVDVGSHELAAYGIWLIKGGAYALERNLITVGEEVSEIATSPAAIGALLTSDESTGSSRFVGNRVQMGAGQTLGLAVVLDNELAWTLENNTLFGGLGEHSVALSVEASAGDAAWPVVRHNTLYGGGEAARGLTSRALYVSAPANVGVWANNLLDAGAAPGRRFLIDNDKAGFLGTLDHNLGQFHGTIDGPRPILAMSPFPLETTSGTAAALAAWYVVLPETGEMVTMGMNVGATPPAGLYDVGTTSTQGRVLSAWSSPLGTGEFAFVVDGGVAIGRIVNGVPSAPTLHSAASVDAYGAKVPHQPFRAVVAEVNGSYPPDIVFTERRHGTSPVVDGGVYVIPSLPNGGYGPAELLNPGGTAALPTDPAYLAVAPNGETSVVVAVEGTTLHVYTAANHATISVATIAQLGSPSASPSAVQDISFVNLKDLGLRGTTEGPDFLLLADGAPYIFVNPTLTAATPGLPSAERFGPAAPNVPPCAGSTTAAYSAANATSTPTFELWLGCANGNLELYEFVAVTNSRFELEAGPITGGTAPTSLASVPIGGGVSLLAVTRADSGTLEVHKRLAAGTIGAPYTYSYGADVALRNSGATERTFQALGAQTGISMVGSECLLEFRRTGGAPFDLHLQATDTGCENLGATLDPVVVDDVDATNTRSDGQPDVGADEL